MYILRSFYIRNTIVTQYIEEKKVKALLVGVGLQAFVICHSNIQAVSQISTEFFAVNVCVLSIVCVPGKPIQWIDTYNTSYHGRVCIIPAQPEESSPQATVQFSIYLMPVQLEE
jgi:hypothetical protein